MGTEELADSHFRQVQAEARIRRQGAASKDEATYIHRHVGQQVRAREQRRLEAEQQPSLWSEEP
jgi:hypothetical protein